MRRVIVTTLLILLSGFWPGLFTQAANASLYLSPSTDTYTIGNHFSIEVKVNTGGVAINAAEGTLVFSTDKLEVVSISQSGSIFSLWTSQPIFSNSAGTISFGGGVPNPGFTGASGKIITITFKAKISGTASVSFSSGAVLANDGKGTNILASLGNGVYTLQAGLVTPKPAAPTPSPTGVPFPPEVSSPTHPNQNKWYSNNNPELQWDLPSDVTGVSILLDRKPSSNPGPYSDGLFSSKTYENIEDGIWYLHLKLRNRAGWSQITHFKIQVDTQSPHPFEIIIKEGAETDNPQPTLFFETKDDTSGIEYYEVKIGEGDLFPLSIEDVKKNPPYQMPLQAPGKHTVVVKAVDAADNSTLAMTVVNILPIESPMLTDYPQTLLPGDILSFQGTALPESIVIVYVQQKGEEPVIQTTQSDRGGQWSYIYDEPVERGIYKIWAQTIDSRGAQSLPSEKITISVESPVLVKLGSLILDHLTIIISILTFLAIIFFGSLYFWRESRRFLRKLRKETREAEQALHNAFDVLKEDVEEQLKLLDKVRSKRELTQEEEKIRKNLKKNLNIAEKYIEKEIKDIKKQLGLKERLKQYFK